MDACIAQLPGESDGKASGAEGSRTVEFLLRVIGQSVSCPAFSALATNPDAMAKPAVRDMLAKLRFSRLYSVDGVIAWAEQAMLLRYLAEHHADWAKVISDKVSSNILALTTVLNRIKSLAGQLPIGLQCS